MARKSRRLWIVTELYHPEDTSTGHFLTGIAEGLAEHRPVSVLCSQPTYAARGTRAPWREERNGVTVRRCRSTTLNKDVLVFRFVNFLTLGLTVFLQALVRFRRSDLVLVVTTPPTLPAVVLLAAKLRGARCSVLVHDVYPDALVAAGLLSPGSWLPNVISSVNRLIYRQMERVIAIGRGMRDLLSERLGVGDRTVVIPNYGDVDRIQPMPKAENRLLQELELTDKFVVQYSGNIGRTHGVEDLLEAARLVSGKDNIHFLFIGSGAKVSVIQKAIEDGASNVTFVPRLPIEELPISLNACDIAVVPLIRGMAGVSVPSRLYNILASGKPVVVVAEAESELARVAVEDEVGWLVPPGDAAQLARVISEACEAPGSMMAKGRNARQVAVEKYSRLRIIAEYEQLLDEIEQGL